MNRETTATENSTAFPPLLDFIASNAFANAHRTDQHLHSLFEEVLRDHGHILDPAQLASWNFALGTRASAPRIEAQYQFWQTSLEEGLRGDGDNGVERKKGLLAFSCGQTCPNPECKVLEGHPSESTHHRWAWQVFIVHPSH